MPTSSYQRGRLTFSAFVLLSGLGLLYATVGTVLPYLRRELGLGYGAASLHVTLLAVGGLLASVLLPAAQRAVGRTAVLLGCALGTAASAALLTAAPAAAVTLPAAGLLGAAVTGAFVLMWGMLSDHHGEHRAVALAEGEVAVSLGNLSLPLLVSGAAAVGLGWRVGVLVAAGWLVVGVLVLRRAGVPAAPEGSAAAGRGALRGLAPLLGIVVLVVGMELGLLTWAASYLDDEIDLQRDTAVALSSSTYGAMLVGRLLVSRLAQRIDPAALLRGALVLTALGLPALALAGGPVAAVTALVVIGVGAGAHMPLAASLVLAAAGPASTRASSASYVAASAGTLVFPAAMGVLAEVADLRVALGAITVLPLAALALLARARRRPAA